MILRGSGQATRGVVVILSTMIWTRAALQQLKEDDLSRQILVPLFTAMGYRDARFHGGGILEQGKDLTMWREDSLRGRVNSAAVVKAVPITGKASVVSVVQQVEQAFAAPFKDTATGAQHLVHECFVITPREVKKEGAYTLHNALQAKSFGRNVTIIDGEQLWQHVQAHLGPQVTLGTIIANYQRLNNEPGYDLQLNLAKDQTTITARTTTGEPILLRRPVFAATPKGAQARERFEHFLRTGEPTVIDRDDVIAGLGDEGPFARLADDAHGAVITLRAAVPTMRGDLCFKAPDGTRAEIPGVVIGGHAGTEYLTLTNSDQGLPLTFTVRLKVSPELGEATFNLQMRSAGHSVVWYARALDIFRTTTHGAQLAFRDFDTSIEFGLGIVTINENSAPVAAHVELVQRTLRVQERTKQPILLPARSFFTKEDIEDLTLIEHILATGSVEAECLTVPFSRAPNERLEELRRRLTTVISDFMLEGPWGPGRLLDNVLDLGPIRIADQAVRFTVEDTERAMLLLEAGHTITVTVIPAAAASLKVAYPRWIPKGEASR